MLENTEGDHIKRFAVELSQIDDPRWEKVEDTRWLYFRIIDDVKIGEIRATMSPQRSNYALNKPETLRLLDGKKTGKADLIVVVAVKTNSDARREHRCSVEAEAFYERVLRDEPTIPGEFGEFWSLTEREITGEDPPL